MANPFKIGSQPYKINEHFKKGGSLTHEEAASLGIGRLAQRVQDLKNKYIEYTGSSPLMVVYEQNERGGIRARYFFRGAGCSHEHNSSAKEY